MFANCRFYENSVGAMGTSYGRVTCSGCVFLSNGAGVSVVIGALGVGCSCGPSEVEPTTWGAIKSMYR